MSSLLNEVRTALRALTPYSGGDGKGVVIVGGGSYLASAYIAMRHLRSHGCSLPIQLWHLGPSEVPPFFKALVKPYDIQLVDAFAAPGAGDFEALNGWECKIHAIVACPFEQVLLLDADNIPLFDPSLVFDCPQFRRYGQIFWPDFNYPPTHQFAIRQRAWKELELPPRSGMELESGQIVVNRRECWRELQAVRAMNLSGQCHRLLTWGDKDTFTLAWLLSGRPYCTVPRRPCHLRPNASSILWQYWFDGRRIFQHQRKWMQPPDEARRDLLDEELLKEQSLRYLDDFWKAGGNTPSWRVRSSAGAPTTDAALPSIADVHQLARKGRTSQADLACRRLVTARPQDPRVWQTRGLLDRELGSFSEAAKAFSRAVELAPDVVQYRLDLAIALCDVNRAAQAIPHLVHALRLNQNTAKVQHAFGMVLEQLGRYEEAVGAYRNTLFLKPDSAAAHYNLARALRKASDPNGAIESFERSLQIRPESVTAYEGIAAAAEDLGDLDRNIAALSKLVQLRPDSPGLRSWLLYNLHYDSNMDAAALFDQHREWDRFFGQPQSGSWQHHEWGENQDGRIRVGYISPDFRDHTVPRFIGAALEHHDRRRFEIFCFSDVAEGDQITERLRHQVENWRDIVGLDDQRVLQIIRDDQIDILVDLRGHAAGNRMTLFAKRAAPVQVNMVGYFDTTGLSAMDYRLSDIHQDPQGQTEQYHAEKLLRLERSCWCYTADEDAPPLESLPAHGNGHITFGSLNKLLKISEPCARLWAAVLEAVPDSKLMLAVGSPAADDAIQVKLQKAGIGAQRIKLVEKTHRRREYLQRFGQIDIALDTFPFNGITTSCDGLWMGVPVVSLGGTTSVSRTGRSILCAAGLPQLATSTPEAFVQTAVELAGQVAELGKLRRSMRDRLRASPLMDHATFTRDLENAFSEIWENWRQNVRALNHAGAADHPV